MYLDRFLLWEPIHHTSGQRQRWRQEQLDQDQHPQSVAKHGANSLSDDEVQRKKKENEQAGLDKYPEGEVRETTAPAIQTLNE